MDRLNKALLGAASLLALTATGQKSADAAIPPSDTAGKISTSAAYEDPLFELMSRTNGSLEARAIERAVRDMLANPSSAQVEAAPTLLASLSGMGVSPQVVTKTREVLAELVSSAPNVNDDAKNKALSELQQSKVHSYKLAQNDEEERRRRRREKETGDVQEQNSQEVGQAGAPTSSDVRLKHDVELLNRLDNGLGLYRFSYIGSNKAYVGVMAQEVEAVMPEAVVRGSDGYLRVHYDMLGIRMQTWEEWVASGQNIPATRH